MRGARRAKSRAARADHLAIGGGLHGWELRVEKSGDFPLPGGNSPRKPESRLESDHPNFPNRILRIAQIVVRLSSMSCKSGGRRKSLTLLKGLDRKVPKENTSWNLVTAACLKQTY